MLIPLLAIVILGVSFGATARREPGPAPGSGPVSIAVLPIRAGGFQLPADQRTTRLTDLLIGRLAENSDRLAVRSSAAVAEFSEPARDTPAEAGEQLEVSFVLVGYVVDATPAALAEFQLVEVGRDAVVWSKRWSGSIDDERAMDFFAAEIGGAVEAELEAAR